MHTWKNNFVEVTPISNNLVRYRRENNYQNNYVRNSNMMSNAAKNVDILTTSLSILYNYFDRSIKLLSDLYLAKF